MGSFHPFVRDRSVKLYGVEAGGHRQGEKRGHPGRREAGRLHGMLTYLLQDENGQVLPTQSISAGLDYPGVGPEHAFLKDIGKGDLRLGLRR